MKISQLLVYGVCTFLLVACVDESSPESNLTFDDISLVYNVATIQTGETTEIEILPNPPAELRSQLIWTSTSPNVASVNNGIVKGLSDGRSIIRISHPDYDNYKVFTVTVTSPKIKSLTIVPSTKTAPSGGSIRIAVDAIDLAGNIVSQDIISSTSWVGTITPVWDSVSKTFNLSSIEPGTFLLTGKLGDLSESIEVTFSEASYTDLKMSELNISLMKVSDTNHLTVIGTKSDGNSDVNPSASTCTSSDPNILTVGNTPTSNGFFVRAYSIGEATITCRLSNLVTSSTIRVESAIATSWNVDDTNDTDVLCGEYKCTVNHISKRDDGGAVFLVAKPNNTFQTLFSRSYGDTLSYNNTLSLPDGVISRSAFISSDMTTTLGLVGNTTLNYRHSVYNEEQERNTIEDTSRLLFLNSAANFSSASFGYYSAAFPSDAEKIDQNMVILGDGYLEALIYDANGGAPDDPEDASSYRPDYYSTLTKNGSASIATTLNVNNSSYVNLIDSIKNSQTQFGRLNNSYVYLTPDQQTLRQNFVFEFNQSRTRNINVSGCNLQSGASLKKRLFVRQTHYPSSKTVVVCISNTDIHSWVYEDGQSSLDVFNYTTASLPENWTQSHDGLAGLAYVGLDAITDTFGQTGDLSVMGYFGYEGSSTSKNHYGFVLEKNVITPLVTKGVIGIEGSPYLHESLMKLENPNMLFNYVATNTSKELWTPYGTLGKRFDMTGYTMNIGTAPFESAVAVPFTYSSEGKKRMALMAFGSGNANAINYGFLAIYNSDLKRLP